MVKKIVIPKVGKIMKMQLTTSMITINIQTAWITLNLVIQNRKHPQQLKTYLIKIMLHFNKAKVEMETAQYQMIATMEELKIFLIMFQKSMYLHLELRSQSSKLNLKLKK